MFRTRFEKIISLLLITCMLIPTQQCFASAKTKESATATNSTVKPVFSIVDNGENKSIKKASLNKDNSLTIYLSNVASDGEWKVINPKKGTCLEVISYNNVDGNINCTIKGINAGDAKLVYSTSYENTTGKVTKKNISLPVRCDDPSLVYYIKKEPVEAKTYSLNYKKQGVLKLTKTKTKAKWVSSEPTVASVKSGKIKGLGGGYTLITATINGDTFYCDTIVNKPVLTHKKYTMEVDDEIKLSVTGVYDPNYKDVWAIKGKNNGIVELSSDGTIKALKKGKVNVYTVVGGAKIIAQIQIKPHAAKNHKVHTEHEYEVVSQRLSTSHTAGEILYHCTLCDSSYVLRRDAEHQWDDGVVIKEPTCEETGEMLYTCVCSVSHTKTVEIPMLGHDFENPVEEVSANCVNDTVATGYCKRCNLVKTGPIIGTALGHDPINVGTISSSCVEGGVEHYICSRCSYEWTETLDANGHTPNGFYTDDVPPTCLSTGLASIHCSVCNVILPDTQIVTNPLGHNFVNGVCTRCGYNPYAAGVAGLYDANTNIIVPYDESGIDVVSNYDETSYKHSPNSPYNIIRYNYPNTKRIILPDNITQIGDYALKDSIISHFIMKNTVTDIGNSSFSNCTNLVEIDIPASVIKINDNAFKDCRKLTTLTMHNGLDYIGSHAFELCAVLDNVVLSNSITSIGESAFAQCNSLTSIAIPNGVTNIGANAFESCFSLQDVFIPSTVTAIGSQAFRNCTTLSDATIPLGVKVIGERAFEKCESLVSIQDAGHPFASVFTIPDSVEQIGASAFSGCKNLTTINLPDNANYTTINNELFKDCVKLENVTIPNSVTIIGNSAFYNCQKVTSVVIPTTVTLIGNEVFRCCYKLNNIIIPEGITRIKNNTFDTCSSLTNISLPDSLVTIDESVFYNCANLSTIKIPRNVTSIGSNTFRSSDSLTTVTFEDCDNWYCGFTKGAKTEAIDSADLTDKSKAAKLLKTNHCSKYWTKE